jgi:hypothetical protein
VLVRTEKLSFISVDKPVDVVDNPWIDLACITLFTPKPFFSPVFKVFTPQKKPSIHSYPQLIHIWG